MNAHTPSQIIISKSATLLISKLRQLIREWVITLQPTILMSNLTETYGMELLC